jgi:hypothetical protein
MITKVSGDFTHNIFHNLPWKSRHKTPTFWYAALQTTDRFIHYAPRIYPSSVAAKMNL